MVGNTALGHGKVGNSLEWSAKVKAPLTDMGKKTRSLGFWKREEFKRDVGVLSAARKV